MTKAILEPRAGLKMQRLFGHGGNDLARTAPLSDRRLNGGGHEMAAGGTIFAKSLEDAENILLKHVEQEMKNETQP